MPQPKYISICEPMCPYNEGRGRSCSGHPLASSSMRPGYHDCHLTAFGLGHLASAHQPPQGPAQNKALQNYSPWGIGVPGSGQSEVVHTSLRSRRASPWNAELWALSYLVHSWTASGINTLENVQLSKSAPKTRVHSIGRAWLWASYFLQHPLALVHPLDTPGRKDHPALPPSQCHCCSPCSLINGVRMTPIWTVQLGFLQFYQAHVLMGWVF